MFVAFPIWWVLGLGEIAWIVLAAVMVLFLFQRRIADVPRGFGIWLMFLLWMAFSVIGIDTGGRLLGFVYRALFYLSVTVVFVYIYNARTTLTVRHVLGVMTVFWLYVIVGGYASIAFPLFSFHTPLSHIIPPGLQANEFVRELTVRRLTQYNPESWLDIAPRPSAPFVYTNGWGNVYSMLMPMIIAYATLVRRTRRFLPLILMIPVSLVPAFLTLNRGMFIGIAVTIVYAAVLLALRGNAKAVLAIFAISVTLSAAALALQVGDRLGSRLEASSSTQDRANLYTEIFTRAINSPLFGYGAPRPSKMPGAPSAGTQGQVWNIMFSNGFPALVLYLAWLLWSFFSTARGRGAVRLALSTVLLVILVESFYYGVLPDGLILSMTAASLLMRGWSEPDY